MYKFIAHIGKRSSLEVEVEQTEPTNLVISQSKGDRLPVPPSPRGADALSLNESDT